MHHERDYYLGRCIIVGIIYMVVLGSLTVVPVVSSWVTLLARIRSYEYDHTIGETCTNQWHRACNNDRRDFVYKSIDLLSTTIVKF